MKPLTGIFLVFLSFGLIAAGIFPFYADFFVEWKPGMLRYFVLGCIFAGVFVGAGNFFVFKGILARLRKIVAEVASMPPGITLPRRSPDDLYNSFINMFIGSVEQLQENRLTAENMGRELALEVEEIGNVIEHVGTIAREIQKKTEQASRNALSGAENVKDTFAGCRQIREYLEQATQKMHLFETTFNTIIKAADTIGNLSLQTDMLSTNASITAAHAGDAGKEFAVVAGEVRKLAHSSHQVTTTISESISKAKNEVSSALTAMETASDEFSRRSSSFVVAGEHLSRIDETARMSIEALKKVLGKLSQLTSLSGDVARSAALFLNNPADCI